MVVGADRGTRAVGGSLARRVGHRRDRVCSGWAPSTGYYAIETAILALAIVPIALTGLAAGSALRGSAGGVEVDPVEVYPFLAITSVLSAVIFGSLVIVEALTVYVVTC